MASNVAALSQPRSASPLGVWTRRAVPAVAVLLLAAATAVLFTLSNTRERSEAAEQVVSDTLLARESIRFQIGRERETLQKMAADITRASVAEPMVESRLDTFMRRTSHMDALFLLDAHQQPQVAVKRRPSEDVLGEMPAAVLDAAIARAETDQRSAFTPAFRSPKGAAIGLVVPVPAATASRQFVVGIYSLERLLQEMLPWNLAQDYEFSLSDVAGTVQARRAARPGRGVYTHQVPLEFGATTLVLGANSTRGPPGWIADALRAGIATLVAVLLWSLWALWRDHRHRAAAERLASEEAAFRKAMGECSVVGLSARDMSGRLTYANPAFCRMVRHEAAELIGRSPGGDAWLPALDGEYRRHLEQCAGAAPLAPFETRLMRRGGEPFPAVIYDAPLVDTDGKQFGWTSSIVDLTQQKQAQERERIQQERLQTAARLTTMGELTSSLAHELNQPLGAVASYLGGSLAMLRHGDEDRAELMATLTKASEQTQRAGEVIRRVHEFVKKQQPRRVDLDVADMVEACRALIELQAKRKDIQVDIAVEHHPATPLRGDPIMLQQVILNLTRNAIDAMAGSSPGRRRLLIATRSDAEGVSLSVRDFGAGIAEQDVERIFQPFFTTKAEGMGMGLSICRSIVHSHGGRLAFERMADGTEFTLWLPRAR
jgi:two-component system sensor histidine kinase DctS